MTVSKKFVIRSFFLLFHNFYFIQIHELMACITYYVVLKSTLYEIKL
jgi:hypothetical protein